MRYFSHIAYADQGFSPSVQPGTYSRCSWGGCNEMSSVVKIFLVLKLTAFGWSTNSCHALLQTNLRSFRPARWPYALMRMTRTRNMLPKPEARNNCRGGDIADNISEHAELQRSQHYAQAYVDRCHETSCGGPSLKINASGLPCLRGTKSHTALHARTPQQPRTTMTLHVFVAIKQFGVQV